MGNNIIREDMKNTKQYNPRIHFLKTFITHQPKTCPECEADLIKDDAETYCPECGLVTSASIDYVAGFHIYLPYGKQ